MAATDYLDAPTWTASGIRPRLIVRGSKHDHDYLPSWEWSGEQGPHGQEDALARLDGVEGLMYPQDALKLYELAWFSPGDVLEIGTHKGRSAAVMASAICAAGNPARIVSLDINAEYLATASANLARVGVADRTLLVEAQAGALLPRMPRFHPGLVFIDGDHTFRGVSADLKAIEPIVPDGALIVLHDYEGYQEEDPFWVQVQEAASASWLARDCVFIGRFGLCGVFVRRSGGPERLGGTPPPEPLLLQLRSDARALRWASAIRARIGTSIRHRASKLRRGR